MPVAVDQRGRILDAALRLMAEQGSAGASMRQLAAACHLNVATLYHYFPSKADLLRSVVEERRYGERRSARR
jgi:AcrR family transcriptional regulator